MRPRNIVPANDDTGAELFTVQAPVSSTPYLGLTISQPFSGYDLRTAEVMPETLRARLGAYFDRLIPKHDFSRIAQEGLDEIGDEINDRPRKILDYATPNEFVDKPKKK